MISLHQNGPDWANLAEIKLQRTIAQNDCRPFKLPWRSLFGYDAVGKTLGIQNIRFPDR